MNVINIQAVRIVEAPPRTGPIKKHCVTEITR